MMADQEISIKNTKAEILDALKRAQDRATAAEKTKLNPEKEDAAKHSLERIRIEYEQRNSDLQAEHDAHVKRIKTERARENEEYQYSLTRTREKENNAWADEKAARESELQKREARAAELLADVESKAGYIRSLEEKVADFPTRIAFERDSAIAATTEALTREHGHQAAIVQIESKNAIMRLEDKVAFLEKELDASNKAAVLLQNKLDKAYSELRDLATKTVESAGNVKIIGASEKASG